VATLIPPVTSVVGTGVALSLLLQLNRDAMDLRAVELIPRSTPSMCRRSLPGGRHMMRTEWRGASNTTMRDTRRQFRRLASVDPCFSPPPAQGPSARS
jgi:hypothetical protein